MGPGPGRLVRSSRIVPSSCRTVQAIGSHSHSPSSESRSLTGNEIPDILPGSIAYDRAAPASADIFELEDVAAASPLVAVRVASCSIALVRKLRRCTCEPPRGTEPIQRNSWTVLDWNLLCSDSQGLYRPVAVLHDSQLIKRSKTPRSPAPITCRPSSPARP